jgi:hypothetical protein
VDYLLKPIQQDELYFNNRLIVNLTLKTPEKIVISREKAAPLRVWLTGK